MASTADTAHGRTSPATARSLRAQWRTDLAGWSFAAPFLLAYGLFVLWPIIDGLRLSFYSWSLLGSSRFIGLDNYRAALQDSLFWTDVWHTLQFTLLSTDPPGAARFCDGTARQSQVAGAVAVSPSLLCPLRASGVHRLSDLGLAVLERLRPVQ